MTEFRKGDKVRLLFDSTIIDTDLGEGLLKVSTPAGVTAWVDPEEVELIEAADDPRADPVGTVRVAWDRGVQRVIRTNYMDGQPWLVFASLTRNGNFLTHEEVADWTRQPLAEVAKTFGHEDAKRRVFRDSDDCLWFQVANDTYRCAESFSDADTQELEDPHLQGKLESARQQFGPLVDVTDEFEQPND